MNEFGTPRRSEDILHAEQKTGREAVEDVLRAFPPDMDVQSELKRVRFAIENMTDKTGPEFHALQVRRAALLEFERGLELPRHKMPSKLEDAPEVSALSEEFEEKYPLFGAKLVKKPAERTYIHEDVHDGSTMPFTRPVDDGDELLGDSDDQAQAAK